jgi:tetratricopeptide (TPR) repeat protein
LFGFLTSWINRRRAFREFRVLGEQSRSDFRLYLEEEIREARKAFAAGDRERAITIWSKIRGLVQEPSQSSMPALSLLLDLGYFDQAEAMMQGCRKRYPHHAGFAVGCAEVAYRRGAVQEALCRLRAVQRRFPSIGKGYTIATACLIKLGQLQEAEAMIEHAVRKLPQDLDVLVEYARLAERRQDWPEAIRRWKEAQQVCRRSAGMVERHREPSVLLSIAACIRSAGRYAEAEEVATRVLSQMPGYQSAYIELAHIATAKGDFDVAARHWSGIRKRSPLLAVAYTAGADATRRSGREAEADEILEQAVRRFRSDLAVHLAYARSAHRRADWPTALERWGMVRERFPDCDEAHKQEACALAAAGTSGKPEPPSRRIAVA